MHPCDRVELRLPERERLPRWSGHIVSWSGPVSRYAELVSPRQPQMIYRHCSFVKFVTFVLTITAITRLLPAFLVMVKGQNTLNILKILFLCKMNIPCQFSWL